MRGGRSCAPCGTRDGARCSARSSFARVAYRQSGAGCGDVNCIGVGRERSVGRDGTSSVRIFRVRELNDPVCSSACAVTTSPLSTTWAAADASV